MLENREISWLSFNYRVLQEAKDLRNPLYERIKFLAIYSSNLDEFFRVRVASLRSLLRLSQKSQDKLKFDPLDLLNKIHTIVKKQQEEFGNIFYNSIIPELNKNNIHLISHNDFNEEQKEFSLNYFEDNILSKIQPIVLVKKKIVPFLGNNKLYIAVRLAQKNKDKTEGTVRIKHTYTLVEIPTNILPRFIELPSEKGFCVTFLDDIIKDNLHIYFPGYDIVDFYSVKLTRDADLNIDDEFTGNLLSKIKKGINKRDNGVPSRFLYDENIPKPFLKFLRDSLLLDKADLVPGGRYHNYSDFFGFPSSDNSNLEFAKLSEINHKDIDKHSSIFDAISEKDHLLFFPYQSYNYVVRFFEAAAIDPNVKSIKITQYRVAKNSAIVKSMIKAVENGKEVMVFVEVKARFDEELNIQWAEEMEKARVKVYYSFPGLKVHAKIALITRIENDKKVKYAYLGTGNFNEKTASIYSDVGLLTKDENITNEMNFVFSFLSGKEIDVKFKHLLVAQFNMRKDFIKLIDNEIALAQNEKDASITLKMNSLEDKRMINKLYEASNAGVKIKIIIRGICCLVPGVKDQSENIEVVSILDRYLEHARIFIFNNDGDEIIYAASADWMKRNLSRRVEVAFPIYDDENRKRIKEVIELQLNDGIKGRIIDKENSNRYLKLKNKSEESSQLGIYNYLKSIN